MHDEQAGDEPGGTGQTRRIRMPIEDRLGPDQWVAEQPDEGVSATAQAEATYQAARRRFETEYGAGGA